MKVSEPYGVGLVTHVKPDRSMMLRELFDEVRFENFDFLLGIGSIYVDGQRIFLDQEVHSQNIIRVHRKPKRHNVAGIEWSKLIVENNEHFVVINKPYEIPTHATVDNVLENVYHQLGLFLKQEIFITHRLDSETTGLLLFAKTKQFQTIFNYLIANKFVNKKYKVLTTKAPKVMRHTHYMKPDKYTPRIVSDEPHKGWQNCELIVEKLSGVVLPNGKEGFESIVQLITGRTHQIRAQFTGMDCALFGDTLYGDDHADFPLGLKAFHLSFFWPQAQKQFQFEIP